MSRKPSPDLILYNDRITTLDPAHPEASNVVIIDAGGGFQNYPEVQYGTATLGGDYSIPSRWIVFRRGEMTKTIDVFIRQDSIAEGPETVSLSLSDPLRAELALRTVALLTI